MLLGIITFQALLEVVTCSVLDRTSFVILSQPSHHDLAKVSARVVSESLEGFGVKTPHVALSHRDLPLHGGWTIFPILSRLSADYEGIADWFVFLHEQSRIDPELMEGLLEKHDDKGHLFIGKPLQDSESVIIHHFSSDLDLKYPDFDAGFIMSASLVADFSNYLVEASFKVRGLPRDFSIDAQYELAKTVYYKNVDNSDDEPITLLPESRLCAEKREGATCATWKVETSFCQTSPDDLKRLADSTLFAVKTCDKHHEDRLPVIVETWGEAATNIKYFSETSSLKFGTTVLPEVTGNTESGHCMKTEAILKYFDENAERNGWNWLVITDDDTLLSVTKLLKLINCYALTEPTCVGQRYGFQIANGKVGYDYPTGGAGMIFNRKLVSKMTAHKQACACPSPTTPDDMHVGACLASLGLSLTHSSRLHQGRPEDYPPEMLAHQDPVSFHKFWNTDPRKAYDRWFRSHDEEMVKYAKTTKKKIIREEL